MYIPTLFTFASRLVLSYQAACAPVVQSLALQFGYCTDIPLTQLPGLLLRAAGAVIVIALCQLFTLAYNSISYIFLFSWRRGERQNGARESVYRFAGKLPRMCKTVTRTSNRTRILRPHFDNVLYPSSTVCCVYIDSVSRVYIDSPNNT